MATKTKKQKAEKAEKAEASVRPNTVSDPAAIEFSKAKWDARINYVGETNWAEADKVVRLIYDEQKAPHPREIVHCTSIRDYVERTMEIAAKLAKEGDKAAADWTKEKALSALTIPIGQAEWIAEWDHWVRNTPDVEQKWVEHPIRLMDEFTKFALGLATFELVAFVVAFPSKIVTPKDERGIPRLHNPDGPVIAWADGTGLYGLEDMFVEEKIVMRPHEQTMEEINGEQNLERRRIRIERYGWLKYLQACGAKEIDRRRNDLDGGTLELLCEVPEKVLAQRANALVVTCPTGRLFCLLVPSNCKTCEQASKYLNGREDLTSVGRT